MQLFSLALFSLGLLIGSSEARAIQERSIEKRSYTDALEHGNYGRSLGQVYKYHQIGPNLFKGVLLDEWDDDIHVPNFPAAVPANVSMIGHSATPKMSSNGLSDQCRTALMCAKSIGGEAFGLLMNAGTYLVEQAQAAREPIYEHLNKPFWANFLGVGGQNAIITGIVTATEKSKAPAEQCSTNHNADELAKEIIRQACQNSPERTSFSQEVVYPDGSVYTLHMAAGKKGTSIGESDLCGAPNPAKQG